MNSDRNYKNWPRYDDDLVNKIYVDEKVKESGGGTPSGDVEERLEALENTAATHTNDIININRDKLNASIYNTFISDEYNPLVVKVDGKIESYYQNTDPSLEWGTLLEKSSHVGDIWYDTTTQKTYVYYKDETTSPVSYYWQWQNVPTELIGRLNSKATMYSGVVPSNYSTGDYWIIPLDCYYNSSTLIECKQKDFNVGDTVPIGNYILTVESIDSEGKILTYSDNIPNNSTFDLTELIDNDSLTLQITSSSNFELPNNCYGGTICISINDSSNYSKDDWIPRNSYIPKDKTDIEYIKEQEVNNLIETTKTEINASIEQLDNSVNLQVETINTTIQNNDTRYNDAIEGAKEYSDSKNNETNETLNTLDIYTKEQVSIILSRLQVLEDQIVATVAKSGGNNLLRNSVGFKSADYWTIANSKIRHDYITSTNKLVTISFKYKKLSIDNFKVTLHRTENDFDTIIDSSLTVPEWTQVIYSYQSSVNNPYIEFNTIFTSTQDNDAEQNGVSGSKLIFNNGNTYVTDLMICYGDKTIWTPYFDEVYGKSHTLDASGLDLLDLLSNYKSHLDSNSLDFKNGNGDIESIFSKAETISDNFIANNTYTIGNLTITKIDDNNILEY